MCTDNDINQYREMIAKGENVIIGPKSFLDLIGRLEAAEKVCIRNIHNEWCDPDDYKDGHCCDIQAEIEAWHKAKGNEPN